MSKVRAIRKALRAGLGSLRKDAGNVALGGMAGVGANRALGNGDDTKTQFAAGAAGALVGGRAMRALARSAAKKAAKRTNNAAPVSAVRREGPIGVRRNEANSADERGAMLKTLTGKERELLRILEANPNITNEKAVRLMYRDGDVPEARIVDVFRAKLKKKGVYPE